MLVIADLQLHSKFSRAVSPQMTIPNIAMWAKRKGIGVVATGDWTHPMWFREIERDLVEQGNGLLRLKDPDKTAPAFLLATEVSCIYSQGGRVRRVHTLIWVPTLGSARKISQEMTKRGCNLMSDGRPIVGLTSIQIAELVFTIESKALIIPAHAWTPWFSVYGGMSGFDSLEEAFGPFAREVYAVETGLSSSPAMNWRIRELDRRTIVSFSDAHSGPKLGREATVFEIPDSQLSYEAIYQAIQGDQAKYESARLPAGQGIMNHGEEKAKNHNSKFTIHNSRIVYTIEFYPEEGKYHYTGHRSCNVRLSLPETEAKGTTCPVCGKPLTQGVMQRVEELAGRSEEELQVSSVKAPGSGIDERVRMIGSKTFSHRPPFVMLVPLQEIIAEAVGAPVVSPKVQPVYFRLTEALEGEFGVLLKAKTEEIAKLAGERIAVGVDKVRRGEIVIDPGYDGVFGVVKIWQAGEEKPLLDATKEQLSIF